MSGYLDVNGDGTVERRRPAVRQRPDRRGRQPVPGPAPGRPPLRVRHRVAARLPAAGPRAGSRSAHGLDARAGGLHAAGADGHGPGGRRQVDERRVQRHRHGRPGSPSTSDRRSHGADGLLRRRGRRRQRRPSPRSSTSASPSPPTHVDATMRLADLWPTHERAEPDELQPDHRRSEVRLVRPLPDRHQPDDLGQRRRRLHARRHLQLGPRGEDRDASTSRGLPRSRHRVSVLRRAARRPTERSASGVVDDSRAGAGRHGRRRQLPRPQRGGAAGGSSPTPPSPSRSSTRAGTRSSRRTRASAPASGIGRSICRRWTRATASTWTCRPRARSSST